MNSNFEIRLHEHPRCNAVENMVHAGPGGLDKYTFLVVRTDLGKTEVATFGESFLILQVRLLVLECIIARYNLEVIGKAITQVTSIMPTR